VNVTLSFGDNVPTTWNPFSSNGGIKVCVVNEKDNVEIESNNAVIAIIENNLLFIIIYHITIDL
jgi:hypothetical protein